MATMEQQGVELMHACGAPAGMAPPKEAAQYINAGYFAEVPGIPSPLKEDSSEKPCLTCPLKVRLAASLGIHGLVELEQAGELPEGCYFYNQLQMHRQTC